MSENIRPAIAAQKTLSPNSGFIAMIEHRLRADNIARRREIIERRITRVWGPSCSLSPSSPLSCIERARLSKAGAAR